MEEKHPWEGPDSASRLHRSGQDRAGSKADFGVLRAVPKEELDLQHIQHAQRSSQLEHAVLENGARWSQSLRGFAPVQ